ncbi:hypothetical protein ACQ4LE_007942 [Meloidogyne hapla]|uniref:Alba domain-containing protein n=1 Tax=Meloidogyne hapla TaxID=6305 RepID=A0A1I8BKS7_MELHA
MENSDDSGCSEINNNTILSTNLPFPEDLTKNVPCFVLKKHTKFARIIARAEKDFSDESVRRLIFQGSGNGCEKCISFVEVFKQKFNESIFQWNILRKNQSNNKTTDKEKESNLINPEMFILVSKDPFPDEYQCLSQQTKVSNENNVAAIPEFNLTNLEENKIKKQIGKQFIKQIKNKKANKWRRPNKITKKNVKK